MKNALTIPCLRDAAVTKNKKRYEDMFNEIKKPSSKDMRDETPVYIDRSVTKNKKRYEDMFNEFHKPSSKDMSDETPVHIDTSVVTETGANIANNMKDELQSFLRVINDANNE